MVAMIGGVQGYLREIMQGASKKGEERKKEGGRGICYIQSVSMGKLNGCRGRHRKVCYTVTNKSITGTI